MNDKYESIQLALFTWTPPAIDALAAWSSLGRGSPGGFQTAPNGQQTNAQGIIDGNQVQIIVQPIRLDIIIQGVAGQSPSASPPGIIDIDAATALALDCAEKVAAAIKVGRVASVWQATQMASSREDAVAKFNARTTHFTSPPDSVAAGVEFTVPMQSKLKAERTLARLCKWQTVQSQFIQIMQQGPVATPGPLTLTAFASHAYADVYFEQLENLRPDEVLAALSEVSDEARRIVDGGPDALY